MKLIKLTQGKFAKVDDENFEWLSQFKWCFDSAGYAVRNVYSKDSRGRKVHKAIYMHRLVLGTPEGKQTDHINGDGLDNQLSNLRIASCSENAFNQGAHKDSRSGIKGVSWHARNQAWVGQIRIGGKRISLGYFKDINAATRAYNAAAIKYHGSFARLNAHRCITGSLWRCIVCGRK